MTKLIPLDAHPGVNTCPRQLSCPKGSLLTASRTPQASVESVSSSSSGIKEKDKDEDNGGMGNQEANNDRGSKREDRSEKEEAANKKEAKKNKLNPKAEDFIPQSGSSNKRRQQEEGKGVKRKTTKK